MTSASTATTPRRLAATLVALQLFAVATARNCTKSDLLPDPTYEPGGAWTIRDCTSIDLSCDFVPGARATPCGNALGSGELGAVTEMLKDAPNLRSLELRGNWLGPLGVAGLARTLTVRIVRAGGGRSSVYKVPLDVAKAEATRDALAKRIYERVPRNSARARAIRRNSARVCATL